MGNNCGCFESETDRLGESNCFQSKDLTRKGLGKHPTTDRFS